MNKLIMRSDDNIWIYCSSIVLIRKLVKQYEHYRILANRNIARDFPSFSEAVATLTFIDYFFYSGSSSKYNTSC